MRRFLVPLFVLGLLAPAFGQLTLVERVRRIKPAVFKIHTYDRFGNMLGQGTGFFVSEDGLALSNWHVMEGAERGEVIFSDSVSYPIESIISRNERRDIALISVKVDDKVPFLKLSEDTLWEGEEVVVIGAPVGFEGTVSTGIVSSLRRMDDLGDVIQITAPISPGSSGSPVANSRGEVIGIATMIHTQAQNLNFAVRIVDLIDMEVETILLGGPAALSREAKYEKGRSIYLPDGEVITRGQFVNIFASELEKESDWPFDGTRVFAGRLYDEMTKQYDDVEIAELFFDDSPSNIFEGPGGDQLFELMLEASDALRWSPKFREALIKECKKEYKRDRRVRTKEYCTCYVETFLIHFSAGQMLSYSLDANSEDADISALLSENPDAAEALEDCFLMHQR